MQMPSKRKTSLLILLAGAFALAACATGPDDLEPETDDVASDIQMDETAPDHVDPGLDAVEATDAPEPGMLAATCGFMFSGLDAYWKNCHSYTAKVKLDVILRLDRTVCVKPGQRKKLGCGTGFGGCIRKAKEVGRC